MKKKRIRAGHKASVAKITAQIKTELGASQHNILRLQQLRKKLQEKSELIRTLDDEIVSKIEAVDEIGNNTEQADTFHNEVEYSLILLDQSLAVTDKEASIEATQNGITTSPRSARTTQPTTEIPPTQEPEDGARVASTPEPDRARIITEVKLPKLTLRKFGGDWTSWVTFWDSFESSIHQNPDLSQVDKFNYLHSLLDGTAAEAIAGLALTSSNYEEAVKLLRKRFGNKQQQISKHMDVLLQLDGVNSSLDIKGLRHLYDKVEAQVRSLKALTLHRMGVCWHQSS